MRKWNFSVMVICFGLALALVGTAPVASATDPQHGGTLILGGEAEWGNLDPHIALSGANSRVNYQIFEPLVSRDFTVPNTGKPAPIIGVLAKSWEVSEGGLVYTFHLREGVKFHDGTPFNAQVVDFNIRRIWDKNFPYFFERAAPLTGRVFKGLLKDVQVVDDLTVVFTLKKPQAYLISEMAQAGMGWFHMVSPAAVKKLGNEEFKNHPVGTGPFRFVERIFGERVVLSRNTDYWSKPYPYLDRLIFVPIPEPATRVNALLRREVNMISVVPPDKLQTLKDKGFHIATGNLPHIWYLALNLNEKPLKDVRVRQAINMAIDKEGMARKLLSGTVQPAWSMVSRTSPGYDRAWKEGYPYNSKKGKELLQAAGYPEGFETVFQISTAGSGQLLPVEMAQWIQRDLMKIGIKVKLDTYEWNTYVSLWVKGLEESVGINQMSWGQNADSWLDIPLRSSSWGNSGHINDPVIDELLDKIAGEMDEKKRIGLIHQLHKLERERAYTVPVVSDTGPFAMSKKVKGFIRAGAWVEDYKVVWIKE